MSKVYVLWELNYNNFYSTETKIVGVITDLVVAQKWEDSDKNLPSVTRYKDAIELNDPELLNRIAKESEKK